MPCRAHTFRISVKNALIVCFAICAEMPVNFRIQLIAILFQTLFCHAHAAVKVHHTLERCIGLQPDNHFIFTVDIARLKIVNTGNAVCLHIQYTAFFQFLLQQIFAFIPNFHCFFAWSGQKTLIALIKRIIFLNKAAYINFSLPASFCKSVPCTCHCIPPNWVLFQLFI